MNNFAVRSSLDIAHSISIQNHIDMYQFEVTIPTGVVYISRSVLLVQLTHS